MKHFKFYTKEDILSVTRIRRFETKLGERLQNIRSGEHSQDAIHQSTARYIIVGIPEDIGIKANYGIGGADTAWLPFLHNFLNIQSNDFMPGENILLLGHFDFGDIKYLIETNAYGQEELIEAYRHARPPGDLPPPSGNIADEWAHVQQSSGDGLAAPHPSARAPCAGLRRAISESPCQ